MIDSASVDGRAVYNTISEEYPDSNIIDELEVLVDRMDLLKRRWLDMIADISITMHDLKEPLRTIINFSKLALFDLSSCGEIDKDSDKNNIETVLKSASYLRNMIDTFSDVVKLSANLDSENIKTIPLEKMIVNIQKSIEEGCINGRNSFTVNVSGNIPNINGHPEIWEKIFSNLFINSIKYNNNKDVIVDIYMDDKTTMIIKDNGIGIDEDKWEFIFEPFATLSDRVHMSGDGIGMGLYMVNRFAEWDGGSVDVLSSDESGTVFKLTLPI